MTVKFLTQKDKTRLEKACAKEIQKLRQDRYTREFGSKTLGQLSVADGTRDEAEYILEEWDPSEDDFEENPGLEEFPACCGASVLCGFEYQESNSGKLSAFEERHWSLRIDDLLQEAKRLTIAILNEHQQPVFKKIFKTFGGECHSKTALGNTRNKLYTWIFIKGQPRSRKKRVF